MSRRANIEKIIIGTLLESKGNENYYDYCSCLVADMFQDATNRRIFELIADMNAMGMKETTPYDILKEYGEKVMDIVCDMVDLCTDYSFIKLKTDYNELRYLENLMLGVNHKGTNVTFIDYIKIFAQLAYSDEREKNDNNGTVTTAA